jgi:serine phosphatase RsbU (regulator of sigma subunit)
LVVRLESGGPPVGMFPNWTHEEGAVQLDTGDLVVAYTDGVTEIVNPAGEEWGEEGLLRAVAEHHAQGPTKWSRGSSDLWMNSRQDARPMTRRS